MFINSEYRYSGTTRSENPRFENMLWEAMQLLVAVKSASVTYPAGMQRFLLFYIGLKFILYVLQIFSGRSLKTPPDMCRRYVVFVIHELERYCRRKSDTRVLRK